MPLSSHFDNPDHRLFDSDERPDTSAEETNELSSQPADGPILTLRSRFDRFALPSQPGPLIGREALVARLVNYLDMPQTRLLTLVGQGGVGKTRIATEIARRRERDHEAVRFIDLTQVSDSSGFARVVDEALKPFRPASEHRPEPNVIVLGNQRVLAVLDNFEHIVDAASQVADLLAEISWLQVIATSRTPLRLRWELVCGIPPLSVPLEGEQLSISQLATIPSVALFTTFVMRLQPEFKLTDENASAVSAICRRMEGIPLALELAANETRTMPIERLLERVDRPLDALVRGPRDLPERQQAMRASIEWSYALLGPEQQRFARYLSTFAGSGTVSAVADIVQISETDAYDRLANLAEHNVLELIECDDVRPRFRMQHMVREFLSEQLATDDMRPALLDRFARYYSQLVAETCAILTDTHASDALAAIQEEIGNIRAILGQSVREQTVGPGLRIVLDMMSFWERPGYLIEGRRWLSSFIDVVPEDDPERRTEALVAAAQLAVSAGDLRNAHALLDTARDQPVEPSLRTSVLAWACYVRILRGDVDGARYMLESSPELRDARIVTPGELDSSFLRALVAVESGDEDAGQRLLDALQTQGQAGNFLSWIEILCTLAELELAAGNTAAAAKLLTDALVRAKVARSRKYRVRALIGLGDLADDQNAGDEALHHYREAFEIAEEYGDERSLVRLIERFAVLGASPQIVPSLLGLMGLADAMRVRLDCGRSRYDDGRIAHRLQQARAVLGADEFDRIRAAGETHSVTEVLGLIEHARRAKQRTRPAVTPARKPIQPTTGTLTRREREVVQQISQGHTNRQIAAKLGMAERTVDSHVANIRQKLQIQSRAQIAVWAVASGLSNPE